MTDLQLLESISTTVDSKIREVFTEYGIENKIKRSDDESSFKKTEQLLWNYNEFKTVINSKYEQIEEIKRNGVPTKSKSILEYSNSGGGLPSGLTTTDEVVENAISGILEEISYLENAVYKIDSALTAIEDEPNSEIIDRYYFNKEKLEEIGESFGVSAQAVFKWKNKLVRKLAVYLFPKDSVEVLYD